MKLKIITILSIIIIVFIGTIFFFMRKENTIDTPEKLFTDFVSAKKDLNKDKIKKLSCPVFGSLPTEYTDKIFDDYFTKISKINFDNSSYTLKQDSGFYFDVQNVSIEGKITSLRLEYTKIYPTNSAQNKDYYCMIYGTL
jgi:hypothetical protein